jgi:hypothetical protein
MNSRCGSLLFMSKPTRLTLGNASLSNSNRFPASSGLFCSDIPVMFPPGRARLATRPVPTGSPAKAITMGMVDVARLAAVTDGVYAAMMTSGFKATSSAANS